MWFEMNSTEIAAWLTVEQFVAESGLSPATVRRRIKDGSLPVLQPGGKRTAVRVSRAALEPSRITSAPMELAPFEPQVSQKQPAHRQPRWMQAK